MDPWVYLRDQVEKKLFASHLILTFLDKIFEVVKIFNFNLPSPYFSKENHQLLFALTISFAFCICFQILFSKILQ